MAEKETIYSSKMKFKGVFSFKDFYKFCYDWLKDETNLELSEKKYGEKIVGNAKEVDIEWFGKRKFTDYFEFDMKVEMKIKELVNVEINQDGQKITTNKGSVEVSVKGELVRDYEGKFETNASAKFLRSIYEKWIIIDRIHQFEDKIAGYCDEFLSQAKAYLDLEGKR
jgi:hypothetical protein